MIRDLIGDSATDNLLDDIQPVIQNIQALGWKELRPWPEFFSSFKPPQMNSRHLEQRITTNFLHYRSNYLVVCMSVLVLQVLFAPMIIFSCLIIFAFCAYLLTVHSQPLVIGELSFDATGKKWLCLGVSVAILFITGTLEKLLWSLIYSSLLCGAHMLFRPRSVSSKANRMYEEMKLSGYGGVFSVPGYESKSYDDAKDIEDPMDGYDSKYADNNVRKRSGSSKLSD